MLFRLLTAAVVISLSGCATNSRPVTLSEAIPASAERVLALQDPINGPSGRIVVTRDKGWAGSACLYALYIDGVLAARLETHESATFLIPAGEHLLRSGRDPQGRGLCATFQNEWTQRETTLQPGETKHFRLTIDANGRTDIQRADDSIN